MDARKAVRLKLAEVDVPLAAVVRNCPGLDYGRVIRIVHGYAAAKEGEVEGLLEEIERLAPSIASRRATRVRR